ADVETMLSGAAGLPDRKEPLAEGARVHGQVLKIHDDNVFVSLGGPDEGFVPFEQFKEEPSPGDSVEVVVRGVNSEDGLYILSLPGGTIDVSDWEDLEEGSVIEVTVTGSNSGGLECKAGGVKGFIPMSQVTEYRIEDLSEFVDQKLVCVVTEANARRGNLVLSRRAVLEREREEKRKEQLAKIEPGDLLEGTVRSIKDFGAFVDLGGLDGLIHISKLSWDRIQHPSEVLEEGQKVKVKIDKVDKDTGKISLSYRDLSENPWNTAEADFAIGTVHKGTVTRIANFGCFVKLAPGVEGLVHISELAHHRVSRVDTMVSEGQEIEVKVLSFDRETQKIGLSVKAVQSPPADAEAKPVEENIEPPRQPAVKASHSGPLKGGNNRETGGERFGLRW
ncbi:MAG: S1 RNA-binding domain-containing protein, partial [Pirellulales bacterium]|nr:S1 RNA-binding domain-containing protein [Pirellulales bacterium]